MSKNGPAPNPCESCPYRRDVPSGVWAASEYAKLREYDKQTYDQPMEPFQCHQTGADSDHWRLCAGWVGCHGQELLSLRLAVSQGTQDPEVMTYTTAVPLFSCGGEAAEHGMADIDDPSDEAQALVAKIAGNREDVRYR
jgi:Family of unknown function (DUF6283)